MDDKNYSFLEYTFMFDSSKTFTNLYEFESALKDFFGAYRLEAEIVKTVEGQFGKRILLIKEAQELPGELPVMRKSPTVLEKFKK